MALASVIPDTSQPSSENAEQLELDTGVVIPASEHVMPPFVKGHIECDLSLIHI